MPAPLFTKTYSGATDATEQPGGRPCAAVSRVFQLISAEPIEYVIGEQAGSGEGRHKVIEGRTVSEPRIHNTRVNCVPDRMRMCINWGRTDDKTGLSHGATVRVQIASLVFHIHDKRHTSLL